MKRFGLQAQISPGIVRGGVIGFFWTDHVGYVTWIGELSRGRAPAHPGERDRPGK